VKQLSRDSFAIKNKPLFSKEKQKAAQLLLFPYQTLI